MSDPAKLMLCAARWQPGNRRSRKGLLRPGAPLGPARPHLDPKHLLAVGLVRGSHWKRGDVKVFSKRISDALRSLACRMKRWRT